MNRQKNPTGFNIIVIYFQVFMYFAKIGLQTKSQYILRKQKCMVHFYHNSIKFKYNSKGERKRKNFHFL